MSDVSHRWLLGLGLFAILADMISPHPRLSVAEESRHSADVPPSPYVTAAGFASERQWLYAHRQFRNQCVMEAFAKSKRWGEAPELAWR